MADETNTPDDQQHALAIFDAEASAQIRRTWHDGRWFYSVVDVIGFLTESARPRKYWSDLKTKLVDEGYSELSAKIGQLKLRSADGKLRETDCADTETLLRIVQSIPSPKAEPFKLWLARVGTERLAGVEDAATAVERLRREYVKKGYSDEWIAERLKYITARNALTDEWDERGAQGRDYAVLTDTLHRGTFDISTGQHRQVKQIGARTDLQDSMSPVELALDSLAHVTATALHRQRDSQGFDALHHDATDAGEVGGNARRDIEARLGEAVVSPINYKQLRQERQRQLQAPLFALADGSEQDDGNDGDDSSGGGD